MNIYKRSLYIFVIFTYGTLWIYYMYHKELFAKNKAVKGCYYDFYT